MDGKDDYLLSGNLARLLIALVCLALSVCACQPLAAETQVPTLQEPVLPTPSPVDEVEPPVAEPTPTRPAEVLPTPTSTPVSMTISPQNAVQVVAQKRLGKGYITGAPAYSPDGRLLAIPSSIGVGLYDIASLQLVGTLQASEYTSQVTFSPDGALCAIANPPGRIVFWDAAGSSQVRELVVDPGSYLHEIAFSPDGRLFAASAGPQDDIKVWRTADGELLHTLQGSSFAFSPGSDMLVAWVWLSEAGGDRYEVYLYDLEDGSLVNQWPGSRAAFSPAGPLAVENDGLVRVMVIEKDLAMAPFTGKEAAFSADGQVMALYNGSQVMLYDQPRDAPLRVLEGTYGIVQGLRFSPDGQTIAGMVYQEEPGCCVGGVDTLAIWRVADGALITTIGSPDFSYWFAYAPDGKTLAVVGNEQVQFLRPDDGAVAAVLEGFTNRVAGLAFSPDGQVLASASGEPVYHLQLWNTANGQPFRRLENPGASGSITYANVVFSPDGKILAMGSDLYRLENGSRLDELERKMVETYSFAASSIAFSPDGKTLAAGYSGGQLHLWSLVDNTLLRKLDGLTGTVESLAYSPDGRFLTAVYTWPDHLVQVWQVPEGERGLTLTGALYKRVALSPDGQTLATLATSQENDEHGNPWGGVRLWRASDGQALFDLDAQNVASLAFSPDGQILSTGYSDGTIGLWQVADGKLLATIKGHASFITGLAFSPDGTYMASGSEDGTVILWGLRP